MRSALLVALSIVSLFVSWAVAQTSQGPTPALPAAPIATPEDKPYPGVISLAVDASDTDRRIFRVHETIPVLGGDELVLLYPEWPPGWHAPVGRSRINRFAGLVITANGGRVAWVRDPVDMYAFHVKAPEGAGTLDIDFQYLSPVNNKVGVTEVSADILVLEWPSLTLYPAGYFTRQIVVDASVKLPDGWQFATALEQASASGASASFKRVPLDTLIDSPIFGGRNVARFDLDPNAPVRVHLNLFADRPELLALKPEQLDAHRSLIQQAYKLFGSSHFDHFDFLVSLSDNIDVGGLEHHRSSQNNTYATYFTEWDKTIYFRDLLPHEFTHSWNGKFRRPADLWTPNYNVPMRNSLLWVYEGLTEYWGHVLTARSGLLSKEQALDSLAVLAAAYQAMPGRAWRPVQDTTGDEIINPRNIPLPWRSWQRFEDYYVEGLLIWLDADTLIREMSHDQHSLDEMASGFFGVNNGSYMPVVYTFDDVVKALNAVQSYEWASFLRARIEAISTEPPFDGITRGGYKLVFNDVESDYYKSAEAILKITNLTYSIGLSVDKDGYVKSVLWDGPAFRAGLSAAVQILSVNGVAFDADRLKDAIKATQGAGGSIELIIKDQDRFRVARIDYHNGLRYPHLDRYTSQPARLDDILSAKK